MTKQQPPSRSQKKAFTVTRDHSSPPWPLTAGQFPDTFPLPKTARLFLHDEIFKHIQRTSKHRKRQDWWEDYIAVLWFHTIGTSLEDLAVITSVVIDRRVEPERFQAWIEELQMAPPAGWSKIAEASSGDEVIETVFIDVDKRWKDFFGKFKKYRSSACSDDNELLYVPARNEERIQKFEEKKVEAQQREAARIEHIDMERRAAYEKRADWQKFYDDARVADLMQQCKAAELECEAPMQAPMHIYKSWDGHGWKEC